jgi:hypothetical protein
MFLVLKNVFGLNNILVLSISHPVNTYWEKCEGLGWMCVLHWPVFCPIPFPFMLSGLHFVEMDIEESHQYFNSLYWQ